MKRMVLKIYDFLSSHRRALLPLLLAVFAQVPPFPRVFFPFFGIWTVILAICLMPFPARTGNLCLRSLPLLFSLLSAVVTADGVAQEDAAEGLAVEGIEGIQIALP